MYGGSAIPDELNVLAEFGDYRALSKIPKTSERHPESLSVPCHFIDHREDGLLGDAVYGSRGREDDRQRTRHTLCWTTIRCMNTRGRRHETNASHVLSTTSSRPASLGSIWHSDSLRFKRASKLAEVLSHLCCIRRSDCTNIWTATTKVQSGKFATNCRSWTVLSKTSLPPLK